MGEEREYTTSDGVEVQRSVDEPEVESQETPPVDGQEDEQQEPDPRAELMERMAAKRQQEMTTEKDEEEEIQTTEGDEDFTEEEPEEVEVKVYGKTSKVPRADVEAAGGLEAWQKRAAASELLRRTNEDRRQFREEQARWAEERDKERAASQPTYDQQQFEQLTKDWAEAQETYLQDPTAENQKQFADLFAKITRSAARPAAEQPSQTKDILELIAMRDRENDRQTGSAWFHSQYAHLSQDPYLRNLASQQVAQLEQEHPDLLPSQIIQHVAQDLDGWYQAKFSPQDKSKTSVAHRETVKAGMNTPRAASGRVPNAPAPKHETVREAVDRMKVERGLI